MKLVKDQLSEISYSCRTVGAAEDAETGIIVGRWTGEVDTWGKFTIKVEDRDEHLYLFDDELVDVEPYDEADQHQDRMRLVSVKAVERTTAIKQMRTYDRACARLHAMHRALLEQGPGYEPQPHERDNFKALLAKVRGLEAVLEARLRGL
jgi:hypothetical protein